MKGAVFWDMRPCSLLGIYWKFRGNNHPDLQKMLAAGSSKAQANFYLTAKHHLWDNNILLTDKKQWIQLKHMNNKYITVRLWNSCRLQQIPIVICICSKHFCIKYCEIKAKSQKTLNEITKNKFTKWNLRYSKRVRWLLINNNFTNCFTAFWYTVSYYERITWTILMCVWS